MKITKTNKFPSAKTILNLALKIGPNSDINQLHSLTYKVMLKLKNDYYINKVNKFLVRPALKNIDKIILERIKKEILKPVKGGEITYSNMMEEASRRISQTFQVTSGNIAEYCVERELEKVGLIKGIHFSHKSKRTDFFFSHPSLNDNKKRKTHRLEVKNVKLRERGVRGLAFDGDSMLGFFDSPSEFTEENIKKIQKHCSKTGGYCYVPPSLYKQIKEKVKDKRFKYNTDLAKDMAKFVKKGFI